MGVPSQYVDISKFPENEKPHIIELALRHNALNEDVDKISGSTPEEKTEFHSFTKRFRVLWHFIQTKGFIALIVGWFITTILKNLGVPVTQVTPFITHFLSSFN